MKTTKTVLMTPLQEAFDRALEDLQKRFGLEKDEIPSKLVIMPILAVISEQSVEDLYKKRETKKKKKK